MSVHRVLPFSINVISIMFSVKFINCIRAYFVLLISTRRGHMTYHIIGVWILIYLESTSRGDLIGILQKTETLGSSYANLSDMFKDTFIDLAKKISHIISPSGTHVIIIDKEAKLSILVNNREIVRAEVLPYVFPLDILITIFVHLLYFQQVTSYPFLETFKVLLCYW